MATTTHKTAPRTQLTRFGRPPQARAEIDRRMTISELPAYMTRDEVAAYLGVGRTTSYNLLVQHGTKIAGCHRLPREKLQAILAC